MTESDYDAFAAIIVGFAELKGRALSSAAIRLYWGAMHHWDLEDFRNAAEHLLSTSEFMPTPKQFEDLRKAGRPTAGEAWDRAVKACGSAIDCGRVTRRGTCGDPLIDAAVRAMGGYGAIAMCETEKLPFLERRFAEHYVEIQGSETARTEVPALAYHNPPTAALAGPASIQRLLEQRQTEGNLA